MVVIILALLVIWDKDYLQRNPGYYPDCYTANRRPLELVFYCEFTDITIAIEKEKQIKKWSRAKKEALINGDFEALVNLAKKGYRYALNSYRNLMHSN